ncbi:RNA polymerase sigma factor RpoH [Candidatus Odyssella acanthamoebae]|uniref:RNA polymerase sigma factor RpoH n=1 Tax=Candidatus Odyssella acanthamoebae TaxID=91604 RepID=A0A077AUJ3_9PROT|nr:RNA polymerase sigma factor RpoH [Candidatus Paracaedibacter acanthamoebae]AIK96847.1 RNA polymerase sigma 70 [Candidatus Paracaedibacter acanthamoebae]
MTGYHDFQEMSSHYLQRMKRLPMLEVDEEYQLAKQWRETGDKKAVDKLVLSHLKLIAKIAHGYRGYGLPISDLISEGHIGIMQAMRHFDPDKGFRLSTYAIWWIKAAIQEYILHSYSLVKIGTTSAQKKLFFNLRKEKMAFQNFDELDLSPETASQIAKKLGVKVEEVMQMNHRLSSVTNSLNAPIKSSAEGDSEWIDWLADDRDTHDVHIAEIDEMNKRRALLGEAMKSLNQREQTIIHDRRLREEPLTLEEVSDKLGVSRERIRQIELRAFDRLQKAVKRLNRKDSDFS